MILALLGVVLPFRRPEADDPLADVRRALAGDRPAARRVAERLMPVIYRQAWTRLRRRHPAGFEPAEVQDLAQEAWVHLCEDGGRRLLAFEPARGARFEGFVGVLAERAMNHVLQRRDAGKRGGGRAPASLDDAVGTPSDAISPEALVTGRDAHAALVRHLDAQLPDRGRLVFRFLYVDGRDVDETAAALGCTAQVVYNWQHKIRTISRDYLARAEAV